MNLKFKRQNTRLGLVFFISRTAKLTLIFHFDGMSSSKNKQRSWRNKMEQLVCQYTET